MPRRLCGWTGPSRTHVCVKPPHATGNHHAVLRDADIQALLDADPIERDIDQDDRVMQDKMVKHGADEAHMARLDGGRQLKIVLIGGWPPSVAYYLDADSEVV